jgi:DNA-binding transcriptional MerR regulator
MDIARLRRAGLLISEISQIFRIASENDGGAERTALAVRKLEARRAALAQLQQQTERVLSAVVEGALMRECASRPGSTFHAMDEAGA